MGACGSGPGGVSGGIVGRLLRWCGVLGLVVGVWWVAGAAAALAAPAFVPVTGSPFATGRAPYSVAFSPSGDFLAVANGGADSVSVFSVDRGSGALTPVPGSPFATGRGPLSVAFSPSGSLLAVVNSYALTDSVSVFAVNQGGALTPVAGSPFRTGNHPVSVAFSPSGGLLATANLAGRSVSVFTVDQGTGRLTRVPGSPFATDSGPTSVAFSPSGSLLAATNGLTNSVSVFAVDQESGRLTEVPGSPFATGRDPYSVAFSPSGGLLATANYVDSSVSVFAVDRGTGGLTPVAGSPFATGRGPQSVAFDPSGGLLATANFNGGSVSVFEVDQGSGALTPVSGSPFATGGPTSVAFSPSGGLLAAANGLDNSVSVFAPSGGFVIGKTADRREVAPGKVLSYTITVRPAGGGGASGSVTDDLTGVLDKADYRHDARASSGTVMFEPGSRRLVWSGTLGAGEHATITYSVGVHGSADGLVRNQVDGPPGSSCGSPSPPALPCVLETAIVRPPAAGADLAVSKAASARTVPRGGQVLYTLVVRNNGPDNATGVRVEDPVPGGLFLLSAETSVGSCTTTTVQVSCTVGNLTAGGSAVVVITARVASDATGTLVNEATVYGNQPDPDPSNNTARSTITVAPLGSEPVSDLVVSKHVNRRTARVGQRLSYTITVTNQGPDAANDVRLTDGPSLPLRVLSVRSSGGSCTTVGRPLGCSLGRLASGGRWMITINAIALAAGTQVNAAAVTSASWDPNPNAALARAQTTIIPLLTLTNTPSNRTVAAGETVTFRVKVSNHNGIALRHLRACTTLPQPLLYLTAAPQPTPVGERYCWTTATLANRHSKTYTITAQVPFGATGTTTTTATGTATGVPLTRANATIRITPRTPTVCTAASRHPSTAHAAC